MAVHSNLLLGNAQLMHPNFAGRAGTYNAEGERNFKVVIPADMADQLVEDGWLVKCKPPNAEGDPGVCLLEVHLRFDFFPPEIWSVTSKHKTRLDETTCGMIDDMDFVNVDLEIRPYNWRNSSGLSGTKAMLKKFWGTINETTFDLKYADIPEGGNIQASYVEDE